MSFVVNAFRAKDFLNVQLEFVGLSLDASGPDGQRLVRDGVGPAFIVMRLAPQHIAEEAFVPDSAGTRRRDGFVSAPSRIAFRLPDATREIPFTLQSVLETVKSLEPVTSDLRADASPATAIEFPRGLLLVPRKTARLFHASEPTTSPDRHWTELWHTDLREDAGDPPATRFRAVPNGADSDVFASGLTSLRKRDRDDIVTRCPPGGENQHAIVAKRFTLSALGASAHVTSDWPADGATNLVAWDHDAELGRDRIVRTVKDGFLFPFRHRASLVTITERRFSFGQPVNVAELIQQAFVTPHETEIDYEHFRAAYPSAAREMPLKRIRLAPPPGGIPISLPSGRVRLDAIAEDTTGNIVDCTLTAFFVERADATDEAVLDRLAQQYASEASVDIGTQRVALAEDGNRTGETTLSVSSLTLGVKRQADLRSGGLRLPFLPFVASAEASIPALDHLLATAPAGGRKTTTITLHQSYLARGFLPTDKKQVFATFPPGPPLAIPADRAGGLAAPTFKPFDGLSRTMGPVSEVERFARGDAITPEQLVGDAKLLGVIALKDIILEAIDPAADAFDGVAPEVLFQKVGDPNVFLTRPVMTTVRTPAGMETRFLWKPKIKGGDLIAPLARTAGGPITLVVKGRIIKSANASAPGFEVEGRLSNFALSFHDLLRVDFNGVEFKSGAGRKLSASVDFRDVEFVGTLKFVDKLRPLLKTLGPGPFVRPLPDGVVIGYAIPIPSIALGAMTLQNIALSLAVSLPFVGGKPAAVRFALSERNNPFLVAVTIFGGTGYFSLELRTDGRVQIEAAIEFGGVVALDLFIVKGGVYLFAGIFLAIQAGGEVRISGHLRLGGYVDVLGLVTVSIELYVALEYDSGRNVMAGEGRITVSVKVLFFSESFSFSVRKEIAGFGEAPANRRLRAFSKSVPFTRAARAMPVMNASQWQKYCSAFA
jgi:hypothetical protein